MLTIDQIQYVIWNMYIEKIWSAKDKSNSASICKNICKIIYDETTSKGTHEEKLRMFPLISAVAVSSMNTMIEGWRRGEQEAADGNDIAYSEIVIRVLERKTKIDYKKDVKRWFPQFRGYCGKRIDGIRLKWWWNKDNVFSKRKIKRLVKKRSLNIYTRPIDE